MSKHYILIDYENVQPKSLSVLQGAPNQAFRIMVFVGINQIVGLCYPDARKMTTVDGFRTFG